MSLQTFLYSLIIHFIYNLNAKYVFHKYKIIYVREIKNTKLTIKFSRYMIYFYLMNNTFMYTKQLIYFLFKRKRSIFIVCFVDTLFILHQKTFHNNESTELFIFSKLWNFFIFYNIESLWIFKVYVCLCIYTCTETVNANISNINCQRLWY